MSGLQATLFAACVGVLLGCPRDEAPEQDDRLLKKLQAEKDRVASGGERSRPIPSAPASPLADRAASPDAPRTLRLAGAPEFVVGKAACRVLSVETSHNVTGGKLSLTSGDLFFKVVLRVQRSGGGPVDFSGASLTAGGTDYPLAQDAQRLAGTRELSLTLKADEQLEVVLYFEAPATAITPGLKLVVAGGDGISLQ